MFYHVFFLPVSFAQSLCQIETTHNLDVASDPWQSEINAAHGVIALGVAALMHPATLNPTVIEFLCSQVVCLTPVFGLRLVPRISRAPRLRYAIRRNAPLAVCASASDCL